MIFRSAVSVRARLIIAALAVCSVALAGCQGGDATGSPENTTTTAAATSSVTPTPTPTPSGVYKPADASGKAQNVPIPAKPPLADQNSKEGLEAFTKYWFELLSYGYETGDLALWNSASSTTCLFCNNLRAGIDEDYAAGGWPVGGRLTTPTVEVTMAPTELVQKVKVQVMQEAAISYLIDGTESPRAAPAGNDAVVVLVELKDGAWFVADMHPLR